MLFNRYQTRLTHTTFIHIRSLYACQPIYTKLQQKMKFVQAATSALLFASYCLQEVASHAVETRYCVTSGGDLRIFIEHWHRFLTDFTNVGTMTITDLGTSTNHTLDPTGILVGVSWDQIHVPGDCAGGSMTIETSTCGADNFSSGQLTSGGGKTENNWVYYDFDVDCNVDTNYRLVQGNTVVLKEGCDELYPVDINAIFTDCPTPAPTPLATVMPSEATAMPSAATDAPTASPTASPTLTLSVPPSIEKTTMPSAATDAPTPGPTPKTNPDPGGRDGKFK